MKRKKVADQETHFSEPDLAEMITRWVGPDRVPKGLRVVTDTSDFFRVDYDDVVVLDNHPYFIRNYEREGRFGIDEEPKFWVRRAVDLLDGSTKIVKMVFHEQFKARVGDLTFECVRSPKKEGAILDMVRGHPNFAQGFWVEDASGNVVRIIDFIQGKTFADYVLELGKDHEDYFYNHFPLVLSEYIELAKAIGFLHENYQKHGDIRRDHIIKEKDTGLCRWIDFDFNFLHKESMFGYDLFGLGNILAYLAGRGDVMASWLRENDSPVFNRLSADDMNIIFNNRVVNLRKVYPYIPEILNRVLLHFSVGANIFYDNANELLTDLQEVRDRIRDRNQGMAEVR
ncbi:MAG TPA: hypothetical protein VEF33_07340 [Syntrophales bacterium]|nr:hypothetical protein [Syntrophales bacterium]